MKQKVRTPTCGNAKLNLGVLRRLKVFTMIVLGGSCVFLQGCVTQPQISLSDLRKTEVSLGLAACMELTQTEIIMEVGAPNEKMTLEDGEVWIYKYRNAESITKATGMGAGTWLNPYEEERRTVESVSDLEVKLLFDKTNKAQKWSYNGMCPVSFSTSFHRRGRQIMSGKIPASVRNWSGLVEQLPPGIRGLLGVSVQENTSGGVIAGDIEPNTPAQRAGLQRGDNIIKVNGEEIKNGAHFRFLIGRNPPGSKVALRLKRDGQLSDVLVTLARMPQ